MIIRVFSMIIDSVDEQDTDTNLETLVINLENQGEYDG